MSYEYRRFGSRVNVAFIPPGQTDLAIPDEPQPVIDTLSNYPNQWARAGACAYFNPPNGESLGTLWAWGTWYEDEPAAWPVLTMAAGAYRIDPQSRGNYDSTVFALGAGPMLVHDGVPVELPTEIRRGGYTGFTADMRLMQAGVGVRPDGLLVHAVADALTLPELAGVFVELGCTAAMRIGSGGPLYENGRLVHGSEAEGRFPCALIFRQLVPVPFLLGHLFDMEREPYRGTAILGVPVAHAEQMEAFTHRVNPAAPPYAALYLQLGRLLGVRGDLAYAQAIHETDYFRYTGDVAAWQFNFGGLGATGGGARGAVFSGPSEGILAQLQHLHAYATTAPLPRGMALADPRFSLVPRGAAPRVGDLNGRWAVPGHTYGQSVDRILGQILNLMPAPFDLTAGRAALSGLLQQRVELGNAGASDAPQHIAWPGSIICHGDVLFRHSPEGEPGSGGSLPDGTELPMAFTAVGGGFYQVVLPNGDMAWVSCSDITQAPSGPGVPAGAPVVIDPGHGGADKGAVGGDGTLEKHVNLNLAREVQQRLAAAGVPVRMTRSGDEDVSLATRSALANQVGARLFVSIHNNAAGFAARGAETYVQGGEEQTVATNTASRRVGCRIQAAVLQAYDQAGGERCPPVDRGVRVRLISRTDPRDYYAVLRNTHVPAVLVEVGFMTNAGELGCLQNADFVAAAATGVAEAIMADLNGQQPETGSVATLYGL